MRFWLLFSLRKKVMQGGYASAQQITENKTTLFLSQLKYIANSRNILTKKRIFAEYNSKIMDYLEFSFIFNHNNEVAADVLADGLAAIGFESFTQNDDALQAYVREADFSEGTLNGVLTHFPLPDIEIAYSYTLIKGEDWNSEWEKNYFKPIVIDDRCIIRSSFHSVNQTATHEIIIDPKMAFGTGHHETTYLMIEELLEFQLAGKTVLDMGCGTAVLAILASMRGAGSAVGVDIDEWACNNAVENLALNNITNVSVLKGDARLLTNAAVYDVVIANINRNILLNDMEAYFRVLKPGGTLFMSGFYMNDIPALSEKAASLGLMFDYYKERNNWSLLRFAKI